MTTKDTTVVRTDETNENGPKSNSPQHSGSKRIKPSETKLGIERPTDNKGGYASKVATAASGFRMNLPQQQRKRKRPAKPAKASSFLGGSSASLSSPNAFGDEEEETKNTRAHQKLLTMSLLASSSSSDEEEGSSLSKTMTSPPEDTDPDSETSHRPESRRPQHEMVQTNNNSTNERNNTAAGNKNMPQDGTSTSVGPKGGANIQNDDGNRRSASIGKKHVLAATNNGGNNNSRNSQLQHNQPEGWRVKLYRLNADGSWDDCGTGRILCLYKPKPSPSTQNTDRGNDSTIANNNSTGDNENNAPPQNSQSNNSNDLNSDSAIYVELGEPTLCMHSEVSNSINRNNNNSSPSIQQQSSINPSNSLTNSNDNSNSLVNNSGNNNPRILLRTRILLRDAYQRQGDNIITWCEPYLEEGNPAQGVDLALSFQDNAGCIDIWRQITQVQSKANEKFRLRQQQQNNSNSNSNNNANENSSGDNETKTSRGVLENNQNHSRSLADLAHNVAAAHHANLQQQRQELWANAEASQPQTGMVGNSQDHHAFEDAMGGIVAAYRDAAGGNNNINALVGGGLSSPQLPNPPTVETLEEIADTIATVQVRGQ